MKKLILFIGLAFILLPALAQQNAWMYLVTDKQFGLVTATTTYADLVKLFGKENLVDETQTGPEGEGILQCTISYKETNLEIAIYWAADSFHKKIGHVASIQPGSPYHTTDGLKIGSTLNDMVKVNKAMISFGGFGWDYGGEISSYNKGKLDGKKVHFTLEWDGKNDTILLGEQSLNSKMIKVIKRAAQIYIARMEVVFDLN